MPQNDNVSREDIDKGIAQPQSSTKEKLKSETPRQKRGRVIRDTLLAGFLDAVVEELKEGRLQRTEEIRKEKRQSRIDSEEQRVQQLEDSYPPVYRATKLLIKTYGSTKKELIPLALKVFLNETKARMFLSLEGEL